MDSNLEFRPEAFVEFLNYNDCGELRPNRDSCFQLRDMSCAWVRRFFDMPVGHNVIYDNMVGKSFIERCANVWHSVSLIKSSNRINSVYLGEERLDIDIPREITLADDKVVVPQRFTLRRLFGDGNEAVGLNYMSDKKQLAYENGIWKFAKISR
jgi:hypothetical protein